ncbi:fasciclin domain-containing protein [Dehalococcoidales bacterium]|nr:fasciclin domain-containing protein [Dehalococcoidales bacterium]
MREKREAFEKLPPEEKIEKLKKDNERLRQLLRQAREERDEVLEAYQRYIHLPSVVSTEKVICRAKEGEVHNAIILIYEDGTINVKCSGECYDCEYEYY